MSSGVAKTLARPVHPSLLGPGTKVSVGEERGSGWVRLCERGGVCGVLPPTVLTGVAATASLIVFSAVFTNASSGTYVGGALTLPANVGFLIGIDVPEMSEAANDTAGGARKALGGSFQVQSGGDSCLVLLSSFTIPGRMAAKKVCWPDSGHALAG